ncbi:hypothetical protein G6F40_014773 [Rhizopus arrhizus]|nr:hypothetical protein G6F40_014773 [Rhizopus arrhizus]
MITSGDKHVADESLVRPRRGRPAGVRRRGPAGPGGIPRQTRETGGALHAWRRGGSVVARVGRAPVARAFPVRRG